jgi:tetratricopeptide (TPR) repeat protein
MTKRTGRLALALSCCFPLAPGLACAAPESLLELADRPGLRWWHRIMPEESHASVAHRAIYGDLALPEGFLFTGDLAALEARYASASATYGYRINPPARFLTFMGTTQLILGRTDRAIEILERTLELYPQSADARDALGRALVADRQRPEAGAAFDSVPSLVERGDSLFALGRFDGAIELYQRAAAVHPDRDVADERLYRSHLALGLFDRASAWQNRTRTRGAPARYAGWWHCRLALTAIFRGESETLAVQTDSLLAQASDDAPESWECAAFNEVFLRRYADARGHLERYVAEAAPDETPLNLGFLHLRTGETEKGERILRQAEARARAAAAETPDSWEPRFELAEIAAMRGDADVAVRHLTAAVERGLGREWWVFHLFSRESLPDPVFEPLYGRSGFALLRAEIVAERRRMRERAR